MCEISPQLNSNAQISRIPPVIVLCGPTAVGKTDQAIDVAEQLGGEIINADSMQVYKGMDIGTAKPGRREQDRIRFHLLDVAAPNDPFTASRWKDLAIDACNEIASRGRVPILCGGTGFYIRSLVQNWSMAETPRDEGVRQELIRQSQTVGPSGLHQQLHDRDPITAKRLHPNDVFRVIRALEVCIVSGIPLSEHHRLDSERASGSAIKTVLQVVLNRDRSQLSQAIERRTDQMLEMGFEREVRTLLDRGYDYQLPTMRSLGYKEMCSFIRGDCDFASTVDAIKINTRRYAKRQLTWFRAETNVTWIDLSVHNLAQASEIIVNSYHAMLADLAN